MKKFFSMVGTFALVLSTSSLAQETLREAVDNGDIATAQKIVKKGQAEEIYCGKLSANDAVKVYDKIFKAMPDESFAACPNQYSYGYGEKVCSNAKAMNACTEVVSYLLMEGAAGNVNAIDMLDKVTAAALKTKAFAKPVKEPVDTTVWVACPKKGKDRAACIIECKNQADSLNDEAHKASCDSKPEHFIETTISVSKPSPLYEKLRVEFAEGYWKSPMSVAHKFAALAQKYGTTLSIPDTAVVNENYIAAWADSHKAIGASLPGGVLFRFCSAWQPQVDSILKEKGFETRCPVFETFEDPRDNKKYKVKEINGVKWFVQNLNYEVEETSMCYDREDENCKLYGRLYKFDAAQTVCPEGTHLSTDEEWKDLENYAGGSSEAAEKLRSNGSDDYAFTVLFGGYTNKNGISVIIGEGAYFWTEKETADGRAVARSMFSTDKDVSSMPVEKSFAMSVRCVMNAGSAGQVSDGASSDVSEGSAE
ncbi:MAG: hypothetical protein HUK19_06010 [Fibrobacter sp.]|nr:hypothetical protein [Fibrobacter sp.]